MLDLLMRAVAKQTEVEFELVTHERMQTIAAWCGSGAYVSADGVGPTAPKFVSVQVHGIRARAFVGMFIVRYAGGDVEIMPAAEFTSRFDVVPGS